MATQIQFRRGSASENDAFTGALGEITVDTTNDSIRIHDGSTSGGFETSAKEALYADVAERYHADNDYEPGTIVVFGGANEITTTDVHANQRAMGIISTAPYCIMNSPHRQPELTDEYHPAVALLGRVPAFVDGTCQKGDIMVCSSTRGHAEAWTKSEPPPYGSILGKAVENKTTAEPGQIEILVGRY